ncbi:MAG: hypothetical protein PHY09_02080 [Desulfuromonadaceae bacterium]|nr:hypothetical protein [Desulfuromonadaceae bacterium]MDD5105091.1 hypothetical protein [Desulfuromonadaceae bacterium]
MSTRWKITSGWHRPRDRPAEHSDRQASRTDLSGRLIHGAEGSIGIISAVSGHFCSDCNRIRVTSTGQAKGCLFSDCRVDLVPALRPPDWDLLVDLLRGIVATKPERHNISRDGYSHNNFTMAQIGG